MATTEKDCTWIFGINFRVVTIALTLTLFALIAVMPPPAQSQTFEVLYNFRPGPSGYGPEAGVTVDQAGNLYGTATYGGNSGGDCRSAGCGTVFKLIHRGSGWTFSPLYTFQGGDDGGNPTARVIIGPNGTLYGTTSVDAGTVFNVRPPATVCKAVLCPWTETVLHSFTGSPDGATPGFGELVFDHAGNLYGTTIGGGGSDPLGTVFELMPSGSGWTETVIFDFIGSRGVFPDNRVVLDQAGNLYGTTHEGGEAGFGNVYELTPSGSGWVESVLYNFQGGSDGGAPYGGVVLDQAGNVYGTTTFYGGPGNLGTVFELAPPGQWNFTLLHGFGCSPCGGGPYDSLTLDAAGNLYGTTYGDGAYTSGSVFKLTPSGGGWIYTSLHDFCGGGPPCTDGAYPYGGVVLDSSGNLYGTASGGGTGSGCVGGGYACGVVWKITP